MGFFDFFNALGLSHHLEAAMLGIPRIATFLALTPFLGGNTLFAGQLKMAIIFALYFFIHPVILAQLPAGQSYFAMGYPLMALVAMKEVLIGFLIAYVSALVFWAAQGAGFVMDNQRGLSQSELTDPLSGDQTSPLGSFLFQALVYLFMVSGAFMAFLLLFFQTYVWWPPLDWLPNLAGAQLPLFVASQVNWLMHKMLVLAGVVLIASLLIDFSLGLVNRFASQLNVYVLAMPIKSGVAMLIVYVMFAGFVGQSGSLFSSLFDSLFSIRQFFGGGG
jgi:type III secretion protein T